MSAFPFTVGDKVRRENWHLDEFVKITAIDGESFRGDYNDDSRCSATWNIASIYYGEWVAA